MNKNFFSTLGTAFFAPSNQPIVGLAPAKVSYPGAQDPERQYFIDSNGLKIAVYEWGEIHHEPIILVHGALDFGRTYDVFAPIIAAAGYRVVTYDHRGHGNSEYPTLYSWVADVRDLMNVINSVSTGPIKVIGHSKGGALLVHAIQATPAHFIKAVIIDGMPFSPPNERTPKSKEEQLHDIQDWLNKRQRSIQSLRKPGSIEELAQRRGRVNPFLSPEWLQYLVTQGAYYLEDGWRWKIDPALNMGEFGSYRARQRAEDLQSITIPFLAVFSTKREPMGWRATANDLIPYFPDHAKAYVMDNVGHFIHIERPQDTANIALEFLAS